MTNKEAFEAAVRRHLYGDSDRVEILWDTLGRPTYLHDHKPCPFAADTLRDIYNVFMEGRYFQRDYRRSQGPRRLL